MRGADCGRHRRVGKSRLATEFAAQLPGWRSVVLTGMAPDDKVTAENQREDFGDIQGPIGEEIQID